MSFNLNSIFLCGMCIFPIFIGGIPLNDVIKQAPAVNAADFSTADQISETPINLKDDFPVVQQESISDVPQGLISERGYTSRDLDGDNEDYTVTPVYGFDWDKKTSNKSYKSDKQVDYVVSGLDSIKSIMRQLKQKTRASRKPFSLFDAQDLGTSLNPVSKERFGDKIFSFKKENDIDSASRMFSKKNDDDQNKFSFFNDHLPDILEKLSN